MLSDYLVSLVRTVVPTAIASFLTWVAVNYDIVLDESTSASLAIGATGLVLALYYGIVRALETRWSWFGALLGSSKQPTYARALDF
jgi:hypothetical protein